jgi:SNF2 family DNA or RNA helicase
MNPQDLKPNIIVPGPMFPEPVKVIRVVPMGGSIKLVGQGMKTGLVHQPILTPSQLTNLEGSPEQQPFDGDASKFKLGIEALRLGVAYEYDPYFSLSIARVDPLPHQVEAVYDHFLRLPRIRFLLADDPGAGKTIMAGLLIKQLKVRGLVKRILIVTPANLSFQWQRELKDKFQEKFEVVRAMSYAPTTARIRGRRKTRWSRQSPGYRVSRQVMEETKTALRELGLKDDLK